MSKLTALEINDIMRAAFPDSLDDLAMVQSVTRGGAITRLTVLPCHMRPGGMISGPTQMTMADHAAYAAIFTLTGVNPAVVTANINIDFLRPCVGDRVYADAKIIDVGTRSHQVEVKVYTDTADIPCSRATVTYVLPKV